MLGQDGAICGLGSPYEFLVKTPEGGVNEKEIVLEFFGGGRIVSGRQLTSAGEGAI